MNQMDTDLLREVARGRSTQAKICDKIDAASPQQVGRYLAQGDGIKVRVLMKICDALNLDIRLLFNMEVSDD